MIGFRLRHYRTGRVMARAVESETPGLLSGRMNS